MRSGIPVETATRVYRRYLKLEPTHVEEYIAYLKKQVGFCWPTLHKLTAPTSLGPARNRHHPLDRQTLRLDARSSGEAE